MDMMTEARRLFAYDAWANREALASLRAADEPLPRSLRWLAHVVGSERLWLCRLRGEPPVMAVWPELSLDQCAAWFEEIPQLWTAHLEVLDAARLDETIAYTNSLGEPWSSRIGDVLHHVVAHSAYHRGQIASDVRAAGHTPAYTDFIHAVRQGHVV
jgi:uncharacterized damage-inducible protein DinB